MSIRKYSRISSLIALLVGGLVLSACGGPTAATPVPTTAGTSATSTVAVADQATTEPTEASESTATTTSGGAQGKLVLYTTRTESLIKPVVDAYQKKNPGVEVVLLTGSSGELSAKLLEEKGNPQADVFINTDTIAMSSLASQGVFEPNPSTAIELVPEEYRAEDATWVALTLRARVIMYNTDLVKPEEAPKSMFDLTDPKWKGQIGSADSTNGSVQAQIVAMSALVGPERTGEFIAGLVANETRFFGGHTDVRKAVGAGELKLGLVNHYYYQLSKAEGAPVGVVYPDQGEGEMGVIVNSTNAGLVRGGPNLPAAHSFVEYLLTMEGQKIFADLNYEYPVREGVELAEGVQPLDQYRRADINLKTLFDELEPARALMESAGLP
ncbi:MAG TPA: extracellular solute-binding protein [Chloroflexia bacterium]|jgi:iron(III) transport system substrate-binding protein